MTKESQFGHHPSPVVDSLTLKNNQSLRFVGLEEGKIKWRKIRTNRTGKEIVISEHKFGRSEVDEAIRWFLAQPNTYDRVEDYRRGAQVGILLNRAKLALEPKLIAEPLG